MTTDQASSSTSSSPPTTPTTSRPARRRSVSPPAFRPPAGPPPEVIEAAREALLQPPAGPYDSEPLSAPSVLEQPDELDEQPKPAAPSSLVSSTDRKALERSIAAAIEGAGSLANTALTDDDQEAFGLYLTDDDDKANIAKPVASLMARHASPGLLSPDVSDVVSAAVAIAVYAGKQLTRVRDLKRARARGHVPTDHTPEQETAA